MMADRGITLPHTTILRWVQRYLLEFEKRWNRYAASDRAVREMKGTGELSQRVRVRSSQYLNNLIEQDHRRVKQRIRLMLGLKRFDKRGGHH